MDSRLEVCGVGQTGNRRKSQCANLCERGEKVAAVSVSQRSQPIWLMSPCSTPNTTDDPQGYYSSDCFADNLISFLRETAADRAADSKPFFAYLPFTAPHQPIQCYKADRDKYKGTYDEGPNVLRQQRLEKLGKLGFIDPDVVPHEVSASSKTWAELSPQARKLSARNFECYAGMVEALDRAAGRVIEYLRETGELDDTLVMVFSDNGPEGGGSGKYEVSLAETGSHGEPSSVMLGGRGV